MKKKNMILSSQFFDKIVLALSQSSSRLVKITLNTHYLISAHCTCVFELNCASSEGTTRSTPYRWHVPMDFKNV